MIFDHPFTILYWGGQNYRIQIDRPLQIGVGVKEVASPFLVKKNQKSILNI